MIVEHSILIVCGFCASFVFRCKTMRLSAWKPLGRVPSGSGTKYKLLKTYLVEKTFRIMSPSDGRKFHETNLLCKPLCMVIVRLPNNRSERFACTSHINCIKIASLE